MREILARNGEKAARVGVFSGFFDIAHFQAKNVGRKVNSDSANILIRKTY